jgi:hypothetical protein
MGLDMYLNKMPRYRGATAKDVCAVENYLDWLKATDEGRTDCTLKEWCGMEKKPPENYLKFYADFYCDRYSNWDTEHKYPWARIVEQVGYWRKVNCVHNWFVENVQDGIDDCDYHREVTEDDLMELMSICQRVLRNSDIVGGEVVDSSVAEELLPTVSGFFFGETKYNEYYLDDLKDTIDIIQKVLDTTDFDTEMIYYVSSW